MSDEEQWDAKRVRIREMEVGPDDPLPEFQDDVAKLMEHTGNAVGRPLVMKVTVEVKSGELARDIIGEGVDESPDAEDTEVDDGE